MSAPAVYRWKRRRARRWTLPLAAGLALALAGVPAGAADEAPGARADAGARIAADLGRRYALGPEAVAALAPQVAVHLERGGGERDLGALADRAVAAGCQEGCLAEAVAAANRAIWLGHPPEEATALVARALKDAARAGGPGTLAERMRARLERRYRQTPTPF